MYFLLILFFSSLLGIALLLRQKLIPIRNGQAVHMHHSHIFAPDLENLKKLVLLKLKAYEYMLLVIVVRVYLKSDLWIRKIYNQVKEKIRGYLENRSISKGNGFGNNIFLKKISDYKTKIRHIRHNMQKEEDSN